MDKFQELIAKLPHDFSEHVLPAPTGCIRCQLEALLAETQPAPSAEQLLHESYEHERFVVETGQPAPPSLSAFAEFDKAVKYLQENGYGDWDGTANGQEATLTGCANMMRQYLRDVLLQREAEIRDRVLEEAAQLSEAQVEAILCGDVYDINDDPDTPKLTAAINAALKS